MSEIDITSDDTRRDSEYCDHLAVVHLEYEVLRNEKFALPMTSAEMNIRTVDLMCGLFGMFGQFPPEFVQRAARVADQALYHRGPDHGSHVVGNEGLLVSRRLAIMDASSFGHQPMASQDGRHKLAYNGMLYNFRELRAELQNQYPFRGNSDTEVVVAALTVWGVDALRRFEGMFALVWWDEINSDVIAAVDHVGMKPLLYSLDLAGNLLCSSELGPLVDLFPQFSVDNDTLGTYLSGGLIDHSSRTLIAGVRQLRRGEYLHWSRRGLVLNKYRQLISPDWDAPLSDDELRDVLIRAVARHRVSDRPYGLSLSSGLDSNLLELLLMSGSQTPAVQAITHSYANAEVDEGHYVSASRLPGYSKSIRVEVTPDRVRSELPEIVGKTLEPIGGLGVFAASCTYQEASARDIRVMLIGEGADELFGGYDYYTHTNRTAMPGSVSSDTGSIVRAPDGTFLNGAELSDDFEYSFIEPEFGGAHEMAATRSGLRGAMWRDLVALKLPKLLRFQDRMSMIHGVEARLPFLDLPVVEASLRVSDDDLVSGEMTKAKLRRIEQSLGGRAHAAKKFSVPAPQGAWIKGDLGDWIESLSQESSLIESDVVDGASFRKRLRQYRESREIGNSFFAWQFMTLEVWHRALRSRQAEARRNWH